MFSEAGFSTWKRKHLCLRKNNKMTIVFVKLLEWVRGIEHCIHNRSISNENSFKSTREQISNNNCKEIDRAVNNRDIRGYGEKGISNSKFSLKTWTLSPCQRIDRRSHW